MQTLKKYGRPFGTFKPDSKRNVIHSRLNDSIFNLLNTYAQKNELNHSAAIAQILKNFLIKEN